MKMKISRNAQLIAQCFFGLGRKSSVMFKTHSRLTDDALKGLTELCNAEMILKEKQKYPPDAVLYTATEKIGRPLSDYPCLDVYNPKEFFTILKPEK